MSGRFDQRAFARKPFPSEARGRAAAVLWMLAAGGCTTFYGLTPDATTSSSSSGAGGAGGTASARQGLLPLLDAAHLCSLVASCPTLGDSIIASTGLPLVVPEASDTRNYSSCIDWLTVPLAGTGGVNAARAGFTELGDMIDCMAASSTCEDANRCASIEVLAPADPACASKTGQSCEADDAALDCDAKTRARCASKAFPPGSHCLASSADGSAACAVGACTPPEVSCDPESDPGPESPSFLFTCGAEELRAGVDCRAYGLVCDQTSPSLAMRGCVGSTGVAACSTFGEASCLGARVRVCSGKLESEVDCGAIDRACTTQGSSARCEPANAACSPYDAASNVCTGTSIHLCVDGEPTDLDCAAIGAGCVPANGPVSAHCG